MAVDQARPRRAWLSAPFSVSGSGSVFFLSELTRKRTGLRLYLEWQRRRRISFAPVSNYLPCHLKVSRIQADLRKQW